MARSLVLIAALVATAAAPVRAADDTLTGTLVSVEDDGRSFTIQSAEGKSHTFEAPPSMDLDAVEPGSTLRVTAEPITDVARGETRRATAVAVMPPAAEREEGAGEGPGMPRDPASGGAPGGGPPSGGIPSGGVPSGGAPGGGIPSGGGIAP